jgi:hypothetical protein
VAIDADLRDGTGKRPRADRAEPDHIEVNTAALDRSPRASPAELPPSERGIAREDLATLDLRAVETEASRCVNCGCVAVHASDLGPALVALDARIRTTRRTVGAEAFFAARPSRTTVLEEGEIVTDVLLPPPVPESTQRYLKFRVRNAIDFPIVGVACVLALSKGTVTHARLVLGAVAAVPLRARAVEEYLVGRKVDDEAAEVAGSLAVRGAIALPGNGHKVQILRTLVKRAVLAASAPSAPSPPSF